MAIRVIDLFSGPGGLGEGFASLHDGKTFKIAVSAEMDSFAHSTLALRAFFRIAKQYDDVFALDAYYAYCNAEPGARHPYDVAPLLWEVAKLEARQLTLGEAASNAVLDDILEKEKIGGDDTVLIGGPPCQAYSLVGRSRNMGKAGYVPEDDHRHYLYRQYLRILAKAQPVAFVMENVKGILSSSVGGRQIFHDILSDLSDPVRAFSGDRGGPKYVIHSLATATKFEAGMDPNEIDARDFVIHADDYGVPQARHRVILLGLRSGVETPQNFLLSKSSLVNVRHAIEELPKLRSRLKGADSPAAWIKKISQFAKELSVGADEAGETDLATPLDQIQERLISDLHTGGLVVPDTRLSSRTVCESDFLSWVRDPRMRVWLNHEARSHMDSDLRRYLYASIFTEARGRSPRGHEEFGFAGLAPAHANWESGKFVDRFKVQRYDIPSSTITSHISKDGHYFIHPDPTQCRALTVREAARLQSFPDNYFFQGGRTQQFHQVGNAVPPYLAYQIAKVVSKFVASL